MKIGRFEAAEKSFLFGGRTLRLLLPKSSDALLDDPDVHRRFEQDEYMPYWAECWPAGVLLAEYLLSGDVLRPGAAILEIGAGVGTVGLALCQAGYRVVITDYDADALAFVSASAALNDVAPAGVTLLDWRTPPADRFDVIIGADVLYERRNHAAILDLLAANLSPHGVAFLSDPNRRVADEFLAMGRTRRFACTEYALMAGGHDGDASGTGRVFIIQREVQASCSGS